MRHSLSDTHSKVAAFRRLQQATRSVFASQHVNLTSFDDAASHLLADDSNVADKGHLRINNLMVRPTLLADTDTKTAFAGPHLHQDHPHLHQHSGVKYLSASKWLLHQTPPLPLHPALLVAESCSSSCTKPYEPFCSLNRPGPWQLKLEIRLWSQLKV
jgi:hypothetical protein